jgi:hypothetical protein
MRVLIIGIVGVCVLAFATRQTVVHAQVDWDIHTDANIVAGDQFSNVRIFDTPPDHTTVDMKGGSIDTLFTYDESTFNLSGGYVSSLWAYASSFVNASGGWLYGLYAYDTTSVELHTSADIAIFLSHGHSLGDVRGGTLDVVSASEFGTVNLYGGVVSDYLAAADSGAINVYGYNLVKHSSGGVYGHGYLTGQWADSAPFEIDLSGSDTYSRLFLHEIPEPATLLLMLAGALVCNCRQHPRQTRR